jgi:Ig-like domain from next to BRCA1 gene
MARLELNISTAHLCFGSLMLAGALVTGACSERSVNSSDAAAEPPAEHSGSTAARAAAFVDQTVPAEMVTDQNYTVSLRMRNTGTTKWTNAQQYRVGSVNPPDNDVWGFHRVAVPADVAPGAEVTFTFALKAPRTPGQYNFQWRMVQDGVEWFGEETPNVLVTVGGQVSKEAR